METNSNIQRAIADISQLVVRINQLTSYNAKCYIDKYRIIVSILMSNYYEEIKFFEMEVMFLEEDRLPVLRAHISGILRRYKKNNK